MRDLHATRDKMSKENTELKAQIETLNQAINQRPLVASHADVQVELAQPNLTDTMFERDGMETPDVEIFRVHEGILTLENIVNWTSQNPQRGLYTAIKRFGKLNSNNRLVELDQVEFIENVYQIMREETIGFNQKMINSNVTMLDTANLYPKYKADGSWETIIRNSRWYGPYQVNRGGIYIFRTQMENSTDLTGIYLTIDLDRKKIYISQRDSNFDNCGYYHRYPPKVLSDN